MAKPSSGDKLQRRFPCSKLVGVGKYRPKNPEKEIQNQCAPHDEPKDNSPIGNITKLLPANTFLMFQTLAPLATNEGNCSKTEIIVTSVMLAILASACLTASFTDTVRINDKVYHGLVTRKGLWNPGFKHDPSFSKLREYEIDKCRYKFAQEAYDKAKMENMPLPKKPKKPDLPEGAYVKNSIYYSRNSQFLVNCTDVLHAVLSVIAFATLTMFTSPVSTCFYPNLPSTVVKTVPLLIAFVVSAIFAFTPPARNGIGYPLPPTLKQTSSTDNSKPADVHQPPGRKGNRGQGAPAVSNLSEHIPIALPLHEMAKLVSHEELVARLINVGAHPDLATKLVQDVKDAVVTQMHQKLQAATSEPLAGRSVVAQPLPFPTHDTDSRGSQSFSDMKPKETNSQMPAFSTPATSVAQDLAPTATTQFINALDVPQEMAQVGSQPIESHIVDMR